MARKSTLKCNQMEKKPVLPRYRYEVFVELDTNEKMSFAQCIDIYAQAVSPDCDELNFYDFDIDANEILVACFKDWSYFVRREKEGECVGSELPIKPSIASVQ